MDNFDTTQGLIASQNQMLKMIYELGISAHVGISYAFSVKELINDYFDDKSQRN